VYCPPIVAGTTLFPNERTSCGYTIVVFVASPSVAPIYGYKFCWEWYPTVYGYVRTWVC